MAITKSLPPKKKGKNKRPQQPEIADEYLAQGVEYEEAAEKWRAGDAVKAMRFYERALQNYDTALERFPQSFDLAYNKARVQFAVTQHPGLRKALRTPLKAQLEEAAESHWQAVKLNPDNADAQFNIAQVLSTLAEEISETGEPRSTQIALELLEKAIESLRTCLDLQERAWSRQHLELLDLNQAAQQSNESDLPASETVHDRPGTPGSSDNGSGIWATVEEPLTSTSLMDTGTALLDTCTSFVELCQPSDLDALQHIENLCKSVKQKIAELPGEVNPGSKRDFEIANANLAASLHEAAFVSGKIDFTEYDRGLRSAFESLDLAATPEFCVAYAEALVALTSADGAPEGSSQVKWNRLSKALDMLTQACRAQSAINPALHAMRGDVELMRHCLSYNSDLPESLKTDVARATLLENAGKFYRGAIAINNSAMSMLGTEADESIVVKEALVSCMSQRNPERLNQVVHQGMSEEKVHEILEKMVDEHLSTSEILRSHGLDFAAHLSTQKKWIKHGSAAERI